jgi:hypothetical protein
MEKTKTFLEVPGKGLRWACSTWRTGPRRETEIPQIGGDAAHTPLPPGPPLPSGTEAAWSQRRRAGMAADYAGNRCRGGRARAALSLPILVGAAKKKSITPQNHTHVLVLFIIMCNQKFRKSPICTWGNPQESGQLELISSSGRCSIVSLRVVVRRSSGLMFTIVSVSLVACFLTELNDQSARAKMRTSLRPPASSARS